MLILTIINACTLAFGAVIDYKKREIPDVVPLILTITAFGAAIFIGPRWMLLRLVEAIVVGGIFILAGKLCGGELPGGDFKLLMALTYTSGITITGSVMLFALFAAFAIGLIRRQKLKTKHIPLCTYVAPAYLVAILAAQIL